MTHFYTKIFVSFWNVILIFFTFNSLMGLVGLIYYFQQVEVTLEKLMIVFISWLAIAILLGAMSIGISAYEKLCRLVELKENEFSPSGKFNSTQSERIEPTL